MTPTTVLMVAACIVFYLFLLVVVWALLWAYGRTTRSRPPTGWD
jgi:hypothetical protein